MKKTNIAVVDTDDGVILGEGIFKDNNHKQNKDFVMLYRKFINQIADLGVEDPLALKILLFLVKNMDNRNALAITMGLISEMTGICRQTVSKRLKYLEENGWIAIAHIGKQAVYIVNPDVVWTSYGNDKAYCRFDAKIMLDSRDNWAFKSQDKASVRHIEKDLLNHMVDDLLASDPREGAHNEQE